MGAEPALVYPRTVKLYHGKKFKLGLDFADSPDGGVVISNVHEGYPAHTSGQVAAGDVISDVNATAPRDASHVVDLCTCRGGRGTDEYVLLRLSENRATDLEQLRRQGPNKLGPGAKGRPLAAQQTRPGLVKQLSRTLSFQSRTKKAKKPRGVWED
mmetsp:Transcript_17993/g.53324  ORF Transcript_17993/g.53324 Transcript_17993/m.53324 type:complete len:156 (+) Transcript_17993:70-537(+)